MSNRKRHRGGAGAGAGCRTSADDGDEDESADERTLLIPTIRGVFNDPGHSDLLLRLHHPPFAPLDLPVSSAALSRSRYFAALISDRWSNDDNGARVVHHTVSSDSGPPAFRPRRLALDVYVTVVRLLHTLDFAGAVRDAADALDLLPVAMQLLFDELTRFCTRFLDSVPWSEEVELRVLAIAPSLPLDMSSELLVRLSPSKDTLSESMLHGLLDSVSHGHPSAAAMKGFLAKVFQDYPVRGVVSRVMDKSFVKTLEVMNEMMGKYASPDFRVAGDNEEREAIQRSNLHGAVSKLKHLYWLIERMIELQVAENAVVAWSEQGSLAADFQKTLKDDTWKNISPALPALVTRCTLRLAHAVVSGSTLVSREVRMKLVQIWLPVLMISRDIVAPMPGAQKSFYQALEETFLQIISTLAISDAQELLQQCLGFSTRNVSDCPHLVAAFQTWFRRADRQPLEENPIE